MAADFLQKFGIAKVNSEIYKCTICKFVVNGVETVAHRGPARNWFEHGLISLCMVLENENFQYCRKLVTTYFNPFAEIIARYGGNADLVCYDIGLCPIHNNIAKLVENDTEIDETTSISSDHNVKIGECLICKAVVKVVKEIVKNNFTKDQIKNALRKCCAKVHSKKCQTLVNNNFDRLVELLAQASSRQRVCYILQICAVHELDVATVIPSETTLEPFNGPKGQCLICKAILKVVGKLVKSSYTKDKVTEALQKVCTKIHSQGCQDFISQYAGQMVDLIVNEATRKRTCVILKVCKKISINYQTLNSSVYQINMCHACQFGMEVVKNLANNGQALNIIHRTLIGTCNLAPSLAIGICKMEVNQHWRQIVTGLRTLKILPMCYKLKFCSLPPLEKYKNCNFETTLPTLKYALKEEAAFIWLQNAGAELCKSFAPKDFLCQQDIELNSTEWADIVVDILQIAINCNN